MYRFSRATASLAAARGRGVRRVTGAGLLLAGTYGASTFYPTSPSSTPSTFAGAIGPLHNIGSPQRMSGPDYTLKLDYFPTGLQFCTFKISKTMYLVMPAIESIAQARRVIEAIDEYMDRNSYAVSVRDQEDTARVHRAAMLIAGTKSSVIRLESSALAGAWRITELRDIIQERAGVEVVEARPEES